MILRPWNELPDYMRTEEVRPYYEILNKKQLSLLFKRVFDFTVSLIMLLILWPVMLLIAALIRIDSKGPALFLQERVTTYGKHFKIWKFRTMVTGAEQKGSAVTVKGDSRITRLGMFLRNTRLDELPQLVNIFKGDMSVVGPRPERPEIAEKYYEKLPDFKLRLQVKAGLTGYAQVYGKYNTKPYEKLEFDLLYINDMSMLTDLKLCFATFSILFSKESTEGIDVNQVTAVDHDDIM